jgi:hypothetical protein
VVGVEQWAEVRRLHSVRGLSIREIHRLLRADPKPPGQRVRELIAPLGFGGGKTIVDD